MGEVAKYQGVWFEGFIYPLRRRYAYPACGDPHQIGFPVSSVVPRGPYVEEQIKKDRDGKGTSQDLQLWYIDTCHAARLVDRLPYAIPASVVGRTITWCRRRQCSMDGCTWIRMMARCCVRLLHHRPKLLVMAGHHVLTHAQVTRIDYS